MSLFTPAPSPWPERSLALLRVVAALLFVAAGSMKVFGYPASPVEVPPFDPFTQLGFGGLLEVVSGLLLALGLFTRPTAFVLSGEMAVAYWQFHAPQSAFPTVNNGVPAVLYCFLFLYLCFAGAGAWTLDGALARRRGREGNERGTS
jgi:putative oxidoreductase